MNTLRTLRVEDGETWLEVSEASVLTAMRRMRMVKASQDELEGETDLNVIALRTVVYPNLAACIVDGNIELPLSFRAFLGMRERLWDRLHAACKELNPHWFGEDVDPNA